MKGSFTKITINSLVFQKSIKSGSKVLDLYSPSRFLLTRLLLTSRFILTRFQSSEKSTKCVIDCICSRQKLKYNYRQDEILRQIESFSHVWTESLGANKSQWLQYDDSLELSDLQQDELPEEPTRRNNSAGRHRLSLVCSI